MHQWCSKKPQKRIFGLIIRTMTDEIFTSQNGDRPNRRNIAIMVTDGQPNDPSQAFSVAYRAHETGITILVIGKFKISDKENLAIYL